MDKHEYEVITEQLARLRDNIESRFKRLEAELQHSKTLENEKHEQLNSRLKILTKCDQDFENRIRELSKAVTTHKTSLSISQALQAGLTLVAAAVAAWLGSK